VPVRWRAHSIEGAELTARPLPSAARRLRRQPLAVAGILLTIATAATLGRVRSSAGELLQGTVNENFRGAYDLLVRPPSQHLGLESTKGLVEQDFLGLTGTGGITLEQLARVRATPAVSLAAPVAVVGYVKTLGVDPCVYVDRLPAQPSLVSYEVTATTSDGLHPVLLQRQSADLLLPGRNSKQHVAAGPAVTSATLQSDGSLNFCFDALPAFASPMIGVDPTAERELLGPSAGFLTAFDSITGREHLTVGSVQNAHIPPAKFPFAESEAAAGSRGDGPGASAAATRPIVPIVVSRRLYSPLHLTLDVAQVGRPLTEALPGDPGDDPRQALEEARAKVGSGRSPLGSATLDATQRLTPFTSVSLELSAPGSGPPRVTGAGGQNNPVFDATRVQRPVYQQVPARAGSQEPSFRASPLGYEKAPDEGGGLAPGTLPGQQTYRALVAQPNPFPGFTPTGSYDKPFAFAPIGDYDLSTLSLPSNPLSYVPLGAYDAPNSDLVAGPDGNALTPRPLLPTLLPTGALTGPPLAITDLRGAATLRGSTPIDAIRVRVAGVTGFNDASRRLLADTAHRLETLGLRVDVVAGSSPQAVSVYLPRYLADGPAGDLGWVRQEWTTLGAAQRVSAGLGRTDSTLLALGLGLCTVFLACLQLLRTATRTRDVALMRAAGLSRLAVLTWSLTEAMAAALFAAVVLSVVALVVGPTVVAVLSWAGLVALIPLLELLAVAIALRRSRSTGATTGGEETTRAGALRRVPVRSPAGLGLRSAVARPLRSIVVVAGGTFTVAAVGLAAALLAGAATSSGPTLLAGEALTRLRPYAIALMLTAAVAGTALGLLALRLDVRDRGNELRLLRASGWRRRDVTRSLRVQRLVLAVVVVPLAVAAAAGGAPGLAAGHALLAGTAALLAGGVWTALVVLLARPGEFS